MIGLSFIIIFMKLCVAHRLANFCRPMNQDVCWGSRPVPGRDWGCSEACNDEVIARLAYVFEQREGECKLPTTGISYFRGILRASRLRIIAKANRDSTTSSLSTTSRSSNLTFDLGACADSDILDDTTQSGRDNSDDGIGEIMRERNNRRRRASMVKNARMSLFLKTNEQESRRLSNHRPAFWSKRSSAACIIENDLKNLGHARFPEEFLSESQTEDLFENHVALVHIFSFLSQNELMTKASTVCTSWTDAATTATVKLMRSSLEFLDDEDELDDNSCSAIPPSSLERSWDYVTDLFPWGRFLSYGAFKNVYRVHNVVTDCTEAVSVM